MEGERFTTNINATYVCLTTLDKPGLIVKLVLKYDKIPQMENRYPGTADY